VQNSAGTAALTVTDDLVVTAPTFATGAGADMTSNRVKSFVVRTSFINDEANNISVFSIGTARATYGGDRLNFNGNSSAFPSLKQSSTTLQARLADDSAFAPLQGKLTTDTAYTATPVVSSGYITIYDSTGTAYKVLVSI
jgi:hypothetical protein